MSGRAIPESAALPALAKRCGPARSVASSRPDMDCPARGRRASGRLGDRRLREAGDDVRPRFGVALDFDQVVGLGVLEQLAERIVAVVLLVEGRLLALHRLLDHRSPENLFVLAHESLDRVDEELEAFGLL